MFDPNTHKKQHYVPVFWQKRFAGTDGVLYGLTNGEIRPVAAKHHMSQEYLYTTFDENWNPSNQLELAASRFESDAARAFRTLDHPDSTGRTEDQIALRAFIAFSVCRHPDTMSSGHRRAKELALLLADVHSKTREEFCISLMSFGVDRNEASSAYDYLKPVDSAQLGAEAKEIEYMQPTDPELPQQLTVDGETIERVFFNLSHHSVTILEAPDELSFVLGDTPFPPELGKGFIVPISSSLALHWEPGSTEAFPGWARRTARTAELEHSNQVQVDNALDIVIGCSRAILEHYV